MTKQLEFTPEIQTTLNCERYHYQVPLVQRRMEVLWLKSHGLSHQQIAKLAGISDTNLRSMKYSCSPFDKLRTSGSACTKKGAGKS